MKASSLKKFEEIDSDMSKHAGKGKLFKAITEAQENPQIIKEKLKEMEEKATTVASGKNVASQGNHWMN